MSSRSCRGLPHAAHPCLLPRNAVRGCRHGQARDLDAPASQGENLPANRARSNGETVWLVDGPRFRRILAGGEAPCALMVMGVSGSGKSTIADRLAARLGWRYEDGDRFHPASNVAKMSAGHPLTDEDRWPWLQAIADEIDRLCGRVATAVIACSALKRAYRRSRARPRRRPLRLSRRHAGADRRTARRPQGALHAAGACSPASSRRWSGRRQRAVRSLNPYDRCAGRANRGRHRHLN